MPSSVLINGARRYVPGVYSKIDASNLAGSDVSSGRAVVVGDFPWLEQYTPQDFTSARAVGQLVPDNREARDIAKMAFAPSTDAQIGGVEVLGFCNAQPTTQAFYTVENQAGSVDEFKLKALAWGTLGNRTRARFVSDGSGGCALTLTRGVLQEDYQINNPSLASVYYNGTEFTTMRLGISASVWGMAWTKAMPFAAGGGSQSQTYNFTEARGSNEPASISLVNGGSGVSLQNVTATFTGLDENGDAASEVLTAAAGGTTWAPASTTATRWSRLDRVVIATTDATYNGTVTVAGWAFYLDPANYETVQDLLDEINAANGQHYHADTVTPGAAAIPATIQDGAAGGVTTFAQTSCLSPAAVSIRSLSWWLEQSIARSGIAELEILSTFDGAPYPFGQAADTTATYDLVGGTQSASGASDFAEALRVTEARDYQLVVGWQTDVTSMQAVINHCKRAAVAGYERAAFMGAPADETLADLLADFTALCNSQYLQVTGQSVRLAGSDGKIRLYDPKYLAVLACGMRAGSPVATPLTNKRPAILSFDGAWDASLDSNEAVQNGLLVLAQDNLSAYFVRDTTTYLTDDNPIYSEGSAWESCQASVRDLRGGLKAQIGNPATNTTAGRITSAARGRLDQQVKDNIIKAYANLTIEDGGDQWRVIYDVAPVESVNFILVEANVRRISSV
jgi:hypothetical protein